ncbi:hypothetical protein NW754_006538 [Fusarium falciforme]|nr:hypothetical protein NW754_006538 [Fusarium falciforme]KAJ4262359.1 hypothetical protein NW757_000620 [Fusarium falciforme]
MAPSDRSAANNRASKASGDADLAQAYRDLARGEQTATALEANLSNLESKLDAILAALEARADPQAPTSATAAEAEGPVKTPSQADGHAEAKEGADKDKHRGKEDTA